MESDPEPAARPERPSRIPLLGVIFLLLALIALATPADAQVPTDRALQDVGLIPEGGEKTFAADDFAGPPPRDWQTGSPPAPPFAAWSMAPGYVRREPRMASRLTGVLQRGDTVNVTSCVPDCKATKAWAILGTDGAVPLRALRPLPVPPEAYGTSAAARYEYGHPAGGTPQVFAEPNVKSKVLRKEKSDFRLAFVPNPAQAQRGWLQRPDGGWMRTRDIRLFTPSKFEGVRDGSQAAFVFLRHKAVLKVPQDPKTKAVKPTPEQLLARTLKRYDHLPLLGEKNGRVLVPGGSLPAGAVRIVRQVPRPKGVAPTDHWIYVDLHEQVLTAYLGDQRELATLVSTGKSDKKSHKTHEGTFKLYAKSVHTSMRGKPWDDHYAEEVPWTMHYDEGRALHGAYWHDQFGIQKSHGCVNLSPADAAWLFQWMPPKLPDGWHSVLPVSGKMATVWVIVADPSKGSHKPVRHVAAAHPGRLAKR